MAVKKIVCECCGGENAKRYRTIALNDTKEYVSEISVYLCDECAKKATNIEKKSASCFSIKQVPTKEQVERVLEILGCLYGYDELLDFDTDELLSHWKDNNIYDTWYKEHSKKMDKTTL